MTTVVSQVCKPFIFFSLLAYPAFLFELASSVLRLYCVLDRNASVCFIYGAFVCISNGVLRISFCASYLSR